MNVFLTRSIVATWLFLASLTAFAQAPPDGKGAPAFPSRPAGAPTGSQFAEKIQGMAAADREELVFSEIARGNIPGFLRSFKEVSVTAAGPDGKSHRAVFETLPDYLAVGSNDDFLRIPMTPRTAQRIADRFGCVLPTRKMVDDIYAAAAVKLTPKPLTKDRESPATFLEHQKLIEQERAGKKTGELTAGHKKDIVVTNRLQEKPKRVAIYGWHQPGGKPIQPLTIVHGETYADYSHGVRLVCETATVDGHTMKIADILKDPNLSALLSDEGVIAVPRYR